MNKPSRLRLYLHIGLPRTGTTTIQHFLRANAESLKAHGVLYPSTGRSYEAHHEIAMGLQRKDRDWVKKSDLDVNLADLRKEVEACCPSKIIISSEILTFVNNAEFVKEKLQSDYDLSVVVFLRRQDDWIESVYRQDLSVGEFDGRIEEYLSRRRHHMNFDHLLKFWEDLVGIENIRVLALGRHGYERSTQEKFLRMCQIPWAEDFVMNDDTNIALSRDCIDFLRLSPDSRRVLSYYRKIRLLLADYTREYPDLPRHRRILSPAQRAAILESCRESNRAIAQRYYPGEGPDLFEVPRFTDLDEWEEYPGLTAENAARIGHFLCRRLIK